MGEAVHILELPGQQAPRAGGRGPVPGHAGLGRHRELPDGRAAQSISLAEEDAEIAPVQPTGAGGAQEPELDRLSNIIAEFNKTWGGIFSEPDRVTEVINRMPEQVLEDQAYLNAKMNSDRQNAQIEHDSAVRRLVTAMVRRQTELYKAYSGNPDFREWLNGEMFRATYQARPTTRER